MDDDSNLQEFLEILRRIRVLVGDAAISGEKDIDFDEVLRQLRQAGSKGEADELAELVRRADELKAQHHAE